MQSLRGEEKDVWKKWQKIDEIKYFLSSIKSNETKAKYKSYFKKYLELTGIDINSLVSEKDPRIIERQIIDFIDEQKSEGKTWGAIHNYVTMIQSFYKINDIVLNTTKIDRFMPEQRKVKNDRGYTHEEISKMLQFCDERTRVIVLLMASTGMRVGAIPELKLRHLEKMENDIYKVKVYENTNDQYIAFTTPECAQAIDSYLDMRARYGEKLEDNCFLIREQFDVKNKLAISKCRSISRETIQWKLREIATRSNVKSTQTVNAHGFRKFFCTQLVEADLNTEKRWKLEGRKLKANDPSYVGITEKSLFQEYQKGINSLTINEENRLKQKVQQLEGETDEIKKLRKDYDKVKATLIDYEETRTMLKEYYLQMQERINKLDQ